MIPLYRTVYCGTDGVLIIEVPLYRTVYCGPNGVLCIEVPQYRTVYCGPCGVLCIEVHCSVHLRFPTVFSTCRLTDAVERSVCDVKCQLVLLTEKFNGSLEVTTTHISFEPEKKESRDSFCEC